MKSNSATFIDDDDDDDDDGDDDDDDGDDDDDDDDDGDDDDDDYCAKSWNEKICVDGSKANPKITLLKPCS